MWALYRLLSLWRLSAFAGLGIQLLVVTHRMNQPGMIDTAEAATRDIKSGG
jgi:hypothetical protein